LPDAAVVREVAVARHPEPEFVIVAREHGETAAERRKPVAATGAVFDRDRRDGRTDARATLRGTRAGDRERDEDSEKVRMERTSTPSRAPVP